MLVFSTLYTLSYIHKPNLISKFAEYSNQSCIQTAIIWNMLLSGQPQDSCSCFLFHESSLNLHKQFSLPMCCTGRYGICTVPLIFLVNICINLVQNCTEHTDICAAFIIQQVVTVMALSSKTAKKYLHLNRCEISKS